MIKLGGKMKVKIIKEGTIYKKGDIVKCSKSEAQEIVNSGYAIEMVKPKLDTSKQTGTMFGEINKKDKKKLNPPEIELTEQEEFEKKKKEWVRGILNITEYIKNTKIFYEIQPFFYDKSGMFWLWNKKESKWEMVDEIDMINMIDNELSFNGQLVTSKIKNNYLNAFKMVGRKRIPKDAPKKWIQFKDKAFSLESGNTYDVTPDYFFTNPIPYEIGEDWNTPTMDSLFSDWVGEINTELLYEIIAYCCYTNYPIHMIFCFIGAGCNGKSKFQQLLAKFIGQDNICSTELDTLLDSRFEKAKLYKKLVCQLGETNFGTLNKTSLLKKLVGQDLIGFEFKNKKPFDDYSYAKILINSNSLPVSDDTSAGFYRRWHIIDFPNQFPEGKDILSDIPESEYNALAKKVTILLPQLLRRGEFSHQGTIDERRERYQLASNPLPIFIKKVCKENEEGFVSYSKLYIKYVSYLKHLKRRIISKKEFGEILGKEYSIRRTSKKLGDDNDSWVSGTWVEGIELVS